MTGSKGRSLFAILLAALIGAAVQARAQTPTADQALAEVREMMLYARYREALPRAQAYLQRTDLTAAQRNLGLELLATLHIALRDSASATRVLNELYARDPRHQLSDADASPPVLSAFGRARSSPPSAITVAVENRTAALERRGPPRIAIQIGQGRDAVAEVRLRYRQGEDDTFATVVMGVGAEGVAEARIPVLDSSDAYTVEYFVELLAPSDAVLATLGGEREPLTLQVPAAALVAGESSGAIVAPAGGEDLWWLWTLIGVVVVGGGVAAGVGIAMSVGGPDGGSLGNIQLPVVSF